MKPAAIILLLLMASGCSELLPSDGKFFIKSAEPWNGAMKYRFESVKGRNTFYLQTKEKYYVGDTLQLLK